jgi:hypothetical protein
MIVGISGLHNGGSKGAGKDTFADLLLEEGNGVKVSLADPLKRICIQVYDFSEEQLWGPSELRDVPDERYPRPDGSFLTPRFALEQLGTEWGRNCYPETWTALMLRTARELMESKACLTYDRVRGVIPGVCSYPGIGCRPDFVVVPDVRFHNEMVAIQMAGGAVIRVRRGPQVEATGHVSNVELSSLPDDAFWMVIENNGSLEDLKDAACVTSMQL